MRNLILLAGSAVLLSTSPALAKPDKGAGKPHSSSRSHVFDGRYGGAACPPGLVKKKVACVPPGQARRMFREGQRLGQGYRYYTPYGNIPPSLRNQYSLDDGNRYIYRDNTIYVVDPRTSLVTRIIDAIL